MSMSMSRSEWPRVVISLIESEVVDLLYKFRSYQSSYFSLRSYLPEASRWFRCTVYLTELCFSYDE